MTPEIIAKLAITISQGRLTLAEVAVVNNLNPKEVIEFFQYDPFEPDDVAIMVSIPVLLENTSVENINEALLNGPRGIRDENDIDLFMKVVRLCTRVSYEIPVMRDEFRRVIETFEKKMDLCFKNYRNVRLECSEENPALAFLGFSLVGVVFAHAANWSDKNPLYEDLITNGRKRLFSV